MRQFRPACRADYALHLEDLQSYQNENQLAASKQKPLFRTDSRVLSEQLFQRPELVGQVFEWGLKLSA